MLRARKTAPTLDFAIPAINIVFLLLLFFIAAGSQSNRSELAVAPPVSELVAAERLPRPLLSLAGSGALSLDGIAVTRETLAALLAERRALNPASFKVLNILPENTLPARDLIELMDAIRSGATLSDLPLVVVTTRPSNGGPAPAP